VKSAVLVTSLISSPIVSRVCQLRPPNSIVYSYGYSRCVIFRGGALRLVCMTCDEIKAFIEQHVRARDGLSPARAT
jgi:hypothetical protein